MEYLINKKTRIIYAVKSVSLFNNEKYYWLRVKGQRRIIQVKEKIVNQTLITYKPGFFEKIKLFFEFYN